ncbi:MAG: SUMF1/EgtB/PvdO family nonheme iron enzyme [Planctomycetota bacterium]
MRTLTFGLTIAVALAAAGVVRADTTITLDMVPVGDAGNVADSTGYGAVAYNYNIGKYDVTLAQYVQFLNAVAKTDTYGLYNSYMGTDYATQGISQNGSPGSFSYSVTGSALGAANMPAFDVTWGDAARFANWLQNGHGTATTVGQAYALTEAGAYTLNGGTSQSVLMTMTRNPGATYFIPSEDEWYKAAYYVGGGTNAGYWAYPTQSSVPPTNSLALAGTNSNDANYDNGITLTDPTNFLTPVGTFVASPGAYGTFDMGGNVWQWNETAVTSSSRGFRGGSYYHTGPDAMASSYRADGDPTTLLWMRGFRVASVPEPSSIAMFFAGIMAFGIWRLHRNL